MEWARTNKHRGFIVAWPQVGGPGGLFLATLATLVFSAISGDQFLTWGWRVPFLISIVMVVIGLYIRLGILETPTFQRLVAEDRIERAPIIEVVKRQPKQIILSALARMAEQAPAYIYFSFIFVYGRDILHYPRDFLLSAVLVAAAIDTIGIPIFGHISDRIGRKRMYLIGAVATGLYALVYFPMLNSGVPTLVFLGIVFSLIPHSMMYGPQGALIAECFTPRLRYSGASLGYQLASIVAGGPAPLIATALLAAYGSGYPIAGYIFLCAVVSIVATSFLPDYTNRDIHEEHSEAKGAVSSTGRA